MPALTDLSDIINRATGGSGGNPETIFFYKDSRIDVGSAPTPPTSRLISLWRYNGIPAGGAVPGSVSIPTRTTPGGLIQADPAENSDKWLLGGIAVASIGLTLILYDRLLHNGGLSGTVTSAQTVGGTITRNTDGVGNQIWVEIYAAVGSTGVTITASYTNEQGTSGRTTTATSIGGTNNMEATRIIPLPLASGDKGVRSVASVTLSGSTGTAGNFGVTIARPLLYIPAGIAGAGSVRDLIAGLPGIIKIDSGACLALAMIPITNSPPQVLGMLQFVDK